MLADVRDRDAAARRCSSSTGRRRLPRRGVQARAADGDATRSRRSRNNVARRRKIVAELAAEFGVERFVLISTDKAVNPTDRDGPVASALCEWIVEAFGRRRDDRTRFVAVRFGNVLELVAAASCRPSAARSQKGGPVTVTHPEMTRYFMTIPEAVSLVVQAGAIGGGGEVFVLDMGEPVKILDLARNMIRLSGKEPRRRETIQDRRSSALAAGREAARGAVETTARPSATPAHPKIMRAAPAADRRGVARRASSPSSSGWSTRATRSRSSRSSARSCASRSATRERRPG